jgi:hypothetical protein
MWSGSLRVSLIAALLLWGHASLAQGNPPRLDPPSRLGGVVARDPAAPLGPTPARHRPTAREQAARDLAYAYLQLWSAPNEVTLASASSFYGSTVKFHGRTRTVRSVIAEKRRLAQRWPDRNYRYRPETMQVACEAGGARCTVWSIFDFSAATARHGRQSLGLGRKAVQALDSDRLGLR